MKRLFTKKSFYIFVFPYFYLIIFYKKIVVNKKLINISFIKSRFNILFILFLIYYIKYKNYMEDIK